MTEPSDDPLAQHLAEIVQTRQAAMDAHAALRQSQPFLNACRRTETLVGDYGLALNAISLMSTRSPTFEAARLSIRIADLLIESAVATMAHIREGLLTPAHREMRFLLEASIKAWWCDSVEPEGEVERKLDFLDDLGAARFRDIVDGLRPRLIAAEEAAGLVHKVTNLYKKLSTRVHASTGGVGVDLRRFERGQYVGFEGVGDLNKANAQFAEVLDISLACAFEAFDGGLLGDIFVQVLDDHPKWAFHKTPLVRSISSHFDYKAERQPPR